MAEIIRFVSKAERERIRLIQEARARYESIFPSADVVDDPHSASMSTRGADVQS
jgi:hypothetical protein